MKVWNYVIILTGLTLLFELAGIPVATDLLASVGIGTTNGLSGLKTAAFYLAIFGAAGALLITTAGVIIGTFSRTSPENYLIWTFAFSSLPAFTAPFWGIVSQAKDIGGWIYYIVLLIMAPLAVGYIMALVEFFRGTD